MAIVSPLRARRNANRPVESTQQMIIFCLRQLWFALPMTAVKRVSTLQSSTSCSIQHLGATASVDDTGLTKIDADQKIFLKARAAFNSQAQFQQPKAQKTKAQGPKAQEPERFSIVFQTSNGEAYVLVINGAPKMHRISPESIVPFSPADMSIEPMECISGVVRQAENPQTIYLLNPEQLCRNLLSPS
jgi:chemotaxis signal transduction protein